MGDVGDDMRAMRGFNQAKRAGNRESSTSELQRLGVEFESKNDGAHLIVENVLDFWPGTGLWINRRTHKRGRGVFGMLRNLEQWNKEQEAKTDDK